MRNLTGVLVFSTTLLLAHGCHKNTGETQGPADASAPIAAPQSPPESAQPSPDSGQPLQEAAPAEPQKSGADSGTLASDTSKPTHGEPQKPGADSGTLAGDTSKPTQGSNLKETNTPEAHRAALESCVDRWLKKHDLDAYGNAEGTMYAGGTPLFDERTGESTDRMAYVFSQKPEVRKVCMKGSAAK